LFSGDVNLQGKSSSFIFSSYTFSKTFLDKKASISIVSNNPYSKFYISRYHAVTAGFSQSSFNEHPYRTFAFRLNFKFGRLNSDIRKNQRGINNDDTKPAKNTPPNQQ